MPFEVLLIGAVLFHALNGLRIILFDFWPNLALKQKVFAYVELVLFVAAFTPVAIFMLGHAIEKSPIG
jgi:succinate dehydrogenase / fumarate reductase cytochrome b subunit